MTDDSHQKYLNYMIIDCILINIINNKFTYIFLLIHIQITIEIIMGPRTSDLGKYENIMEI